jgi:hypothetical protein
MKREMAGGCHVPLLWGVLFTCLGLGCKSPRPWEAPPNLERDDAAADSRGSDRSTDAQRAPDLDVVLQGDAPVDPDAASVDGILGPPPVGTDAQTSIPASCGNSVVETGEECDPPGTCPATCANQGCTRFVLQGSASQCNARCVEAGKITACASGDSCCADGCFATNDAECAAKCDNGMKEGSETCDPLATCPTGCPAMGCQLRKLVNVGTCAAACVDDRKQTTCVSSDGCCPAGCDSTNDGDCPARCGNSVLENGETCDPVSQCNARRMACASDRNVIRAPSGDAASCTFVCGETARACGPSDGECPNGCDSGRDGDCKKAAGAGCSNGAECATSACVDGIAAAKAAERARSAGVPRVLAKVSPAGSVTTVPLERVGGVPSAMVKSRPDVLSQNARYRTGNAKEIVSCVVVPIGLISNSNAPVPELNRIASRAPAPNAGMEVPVARRAKSTACRAPGCSAARARAVSAGSRPTRTFATFVA